MMAWAYLPAVVLTVSAAAAAALDMPSAAHMTVDRTAPLERYAAPVAAFDGISLPVVEIEGRLRQQVWEVPGGALRPLQIVGPLRDQLLAQGFELVLDCMAAECGGFDFRFNTDVLPAPNMFVNLRSFQFVTLRKGPETAPAAIVTLLASALRETAYVQITDVRNSQAESTIQPVPSLAVQEPARGILEAGSIVLEGLEFETGATRLGSGPFSSLQQLAVLLEANPNLRIALVGHTDSVGSLDGNIRISRDRARAVRKRLIDAHGIDPARVDAQGMGYLAPRASNLTEQGRDANRRVEAILLSDE